MTNEQILHFAESMNYAHLVVDSSCHIGYGRESWQTALPLLSDEKREALVAKIEHWRARVAQEVMV